MSQLLQQYITLFSTPLYIIIIGAEILLSRLHEVKTYTFKDSVYNFTLSLLTGGIDFLMRGLSLAVLLLAFQVHLFDLSHSVLYWGALLLLTDLAHYGLHYTSHYCRFFWAVHVNHHSSQHFNFSVGFRSGVLEPLYSFLFFLPVAWLGFQPLDILLMYSITQIWAILTHTEKVSKLGWMEYIFVTPSHHRVHHASNPKYLDRNMGTVFIIWDRLFGTFQEELPASTYAPIHYGLTHPLEKETLPHVIFHEWKAIWKDIHQKGLSWKDKWHYIFGPPGWSHDGSRLTSEGMRAAEQRQTNATDKIRTDQYEVRNEPPEKTQTASSGRSNMVSEEEMLSH